MMTTRYSPKRTSSVQDISHKPPFGSREVPALSLTPISRLTHKSRFLTEEDNVWSQNAWDHVPPPADQDATIAASLARQRAAPVPDSDKHRYNAKPEKHWSVPFPPNIPLLKVLMGPIGTTFTKQTPQTSSRTASGAFFLRISVVIGIGGSIRVHLTGCNSNSRSSSLLPSHRCAHPLIAVETPS
jgi:hypothetical protein